MQISKKELFQQAAETQFQPDILEKVWHLMSLLETINADAYLESRLALKGGTALNLFIFHLPRLSVDIDLNYIGSHDREIMLQERSVIEKILEAIISHHGLSVRRIQGGHAGSKWFLKYPSVVNSSGNLEIDLNFMHRIPIWDTQKCASHTIGDHEIQNIRLMNTYDILGGKVAALLDRHAARDFFDAHQIFSSLELDEEKFRIACVLYGTMGSTDLRRVSPDQLSLNLDEIKRFLIPLLIKDNVIRTQWTNKAESFLAECKNGFKKFLFPLTEHELEFLESFYQQGTIEPQLLTNSLEMREKISNLPALKWRLETLVNKSA